VRAEKSQRIEREQKLQSEYDALQQQVSSELEVLSTIKAEPGQDMPHSFKTKKSFSDTCILNP